MIVKSSAQILKQVLSNSAKHVPEKIAIIGSGNWGSVVSRIVGSNVLLYPQIFDKDINMYVHEEMVNGKKLTEIINSTHENVKYLPGYSIPDNVCANPCLLSSVKDASILIFVIPHQFLKATCDTLKNHINPDARAISLIKGMEVNFANGEMTSISDIIRDELKIDTSVLMGANIAQEIAKGDFSEATLGYTNKENSLLLKLLFQTKYFKVSTVEDVYGVELCGALKNIVAIAAGLSDGLGYGQNTKAAIIRIGILEMKKFIKLFFRGVLDDTFFESCGVADVITTCYGGRNRKVAEEFVKSGKPFEQLEVEMLNGQKLQGTLTAEEVYQVLLKNNLVGEFPLFVKTYRVIFEAAPPSSLVDGL